MSKAKISHIKYLATDNSLSYKKLKEMITVAEKGKFYTMKDLDIKISEWKLRYSKKSNPAL